MEAGKTKIHLDIIEKLLAFFKIYSLEDIASSEFKIKDDFRELLINYYEKESEFVNLTKKDPTIVYAIKYKLLPSNFIEQPKEINEIRLFFGKFGWNYKGTSISNALKRMPELINIKPHPNKGNTNLYSAIIKNKLS